MAVSAGGGAENLDYSGYTYEQLRAAVYGFREEGVRVAANEWADLRRRLNERLGTLHVAIATLTPDWVSPGGREAIEALSRQRDSMTELARVAAWNEERMTQVQSTYYQAVRAMQALDAEPDRPSPGPSSAGYVHPSTLNRKQPQAAEITNSLYHAIAVAAASMAEPRQGPRLDLRPNGDGGSKGRFQESQGARHIEGRHVSATTASSSGSMSLREVVTVPQESPSKTSAVDPTGKIVQAAVDSSVGGTALGSAALGLVGGARSTDRANTHSATSRVAGLIPRGAAGANSSVRRTGVIGPRGGVSHLPSATTDIDSRVAGPAPRDSTRLSPALNSHVGVPGAGPATNQTSPGSRPKPGYEKGEPESFVRGPSGSVPGGVVQGTRHLDAFAPLPGTVGGQKSSSTSDGRVLDAPEHRTEYRSSEFPDQSENFKRHDGVQFEMRRRIREA